MGKSFSGFHSPVLRLASLVLFFSFAFSLFSVNYAQVKIKEKVEIKNVKDQNYLSIKDSLLKLTNITSNTFPVSLDKTNSDFILEEESVVKVYINESSAAANIALYLRSPNSVLIKAEANKSSGFRWESNTLPAQTVVEFGIDWSYDGQSGTEAGKTITQIDDTRYRIGFEDLGGMLTDYNDLVITVDICKGGAKIATIGDWLADWIFHTEKMDIPFEVISCYDDISEIEDMTFTADITTGDEFGIIINPVTNETGTTLTNISHENSLFELQYFANGTPSDEDEDIIITVTASNPDVEPISIEFSIYPTDIIVRFEKSELKLGDTTKVYLYDRNTGAPFPEDQSFYVEISEDTEAREYAYLSSLSADDQGGWMDEATQPFLLIATEEIDLDSISIIVNAETYDEDEGDVIWGAGNIELKRENEVKLEILYPTKDSTIIYNINDIPEMPNIISRAKLHSNNLLENQTINWSCNVSYDYPPCNDEETYNEEIVFNTANISEWNINFGDSETIIGGKAVIIATTTIDNKQYSDTIIVYIRGENPKDADIEAQTDEGQLAMIKTEVPGYSQFGTENYAEPNERLPLQSDADFHGWGLCQLDDRFHEINTALLWDWTANLEHGLGYYNVQRDGAENRLQNIGHLDMPPEGFTRQSMIDSEGYARYNGGPKAKIWVWIEPNRDNAIGHWEQNATTRRKVKGTWTTVHNQGLEVHVSNYIAHYND